MSRKKYVVTLDPGEREYLLQFVSTGKVAARALTHAHILLKADESPKGSGWNDVHIAEALSVTVRTIETVRKGFSERGLKGCLAKKPRDDPSRPLRRGLQELVHQSPRNFGKKRSTWTLQLLADTCSEIGIADGKVSHETVRRA